MIPHTLRASIFIIIFFLRIYTSGAVKRLSDSFWLFQSNFQVNNLYLVYFRRINLKFTWIYVICEIYSGSWVTYVFLMSFITVSLARQFHELIRITCAPASFFFFFLFIHSQAFVCLLFDPILTIFKEITNSLIVLVQHQYILFFFFCNLHFIYYHQFYFTRLHLSLT